MTEAEAQSLREDYLDRLDAAIAELPWRVANDLRSGIAEELDGLDAAALHARIGQLGDPAQIAAAAKEETGSAPPAPVVVVAPAPVPVGKSPMVDTKWFAIMGALLLGFGGIVAPMVGWIVGVAFVTSSRFWRRWEKSVAILLPFATAVLAWLASTAASTFWVVEPDSEGAGRNPFVPTAAWNLSMIVIVMTVVCALWLLWRLRGRDVPLPRG
ncbi:MAG: hypothetical protein JST33_02840 [Actinobacteria bacterium]|nr:hypothetical protein [Actinomycetota bacterium]